MGHLSPHRPLFEELLQLGHEVHVASRCAAKAARAFKGLAIASYWQAPFNAARPEPMIKPTPTLAEVLHNSGFDSADAMHARTLAWDGILGAVRPDAVLADFSPTLLMVLRGTGIPCATLGTAFLVPPHEDPMPSYPTLKQQPLGNSVSHVPVKNRINETLERRGQEPVAGISDLFHGKDTLRVLQTYRELDHFPSRQDGLYVGCPPAPEGGPIPDWPNGKGPRVFAYLKNSKGLPKILEELANLRTPTIVVTDGVPDDVRRRHARPYMSVQAGRVDIHRVMTEAAVAITNGNHATTAQFLYAGVPLLCMPLFLEQITTGVNVGRMRAGLMGDGDVGRGVTGAVRRLVSEARFRDAALSFGARNATLPFAGHTQRTIEALRQLIPI